MRKIMWDFFDKYVEFNLDKNGLHRVTNVSFSSGNYAVLGYLFDELNLGSNQNFSKSDAGLYISSSISYDGNFVNKICPSKGILCIHDVKITDSVDSIVRADEQRLSIVSGSQVTDVFFRKQRYLANRVNSAQRHF